MINIEKKLEEIYSSFVESCFSDYNERTEKAKDVMRLTFFAGILSYVSITEIVTELCGMADSVNHFQRLEDHAKKSFNEILSKYEKEQKEYTNLTSDEVKGIINKLLKDSKS